MIVCSTNCPFPIQLYIFSSRIILITYLQGLVTGKCSSMKPNVYPCVALDLRILLVLYIIFLNDHTLVSRQRPTSLSWCNLTQNSFMAPHTNSIDVKATNMLDSILTDVYLKPRKLPLSPTNTGILLLCAILIHYPIQLQLLLLENIYRRAAWVISNYDYHQSLNVFQNHLSWPTLQLQIVISQNIHHLAS